MKRFLILFFSFVLTVSLFLTVGCGTSCAQKNSGTGDGQNTQGDSEEITEMFIEVNGNRLKVTLEQNSSVEALLNVLECDDITFTAYENGGFEIYGDIGHTLPSNNSRINAQAGDVLLWAGSNVCIFFGNNSYSYTRIGKINGYTPSELRTLLCANQGRVQVKISLK